MDFIKIRKSARRAGLGRRKWSPGRERRGTRYLRSRKSILYDFTFIWNLKNNTNKNRNRLAVTRGEEVGGLGGKRKGIEKHRSVVTEQSWDVKSAWET